MHKVLDVAATGVAQGAMIALVALGYTMVFGVLRLINFAHSEVFMFGAYGGLFALSLAPAASGGVQVALAIGGAMLVTAAIGFLTDRFAYKPIRRAPRTPLTRMTPLVTAIALSVLLQNVAQLLFGAEFRPYPNARLGTRGFIVGTSAVVMLALEWLVHKTWFGKAMRALSMNEEAARLMGIRTSTVIVRTFILGSGLAAVAAVLYCFDQSQVYPTMGTVIGTRAFVAAVLGGVGSIRGALFGGLLLGVIGELVKLTDYSGGVDVLVFLVLIGVLLVRPKGLFGRLTPEKV